MKIAIPYFTQYKYYTCGCICAKMILHRLWIKVEREDLIKIMWAQPNVGVEVEDLYKVFSSYNLDYKTKIETQIDEVVHYLESGYPVLVNYINPLWWVGHFSIINWYFPEEELFIMADPRNWQDYTISYSDFDAQWRNTKWDIKKWSLIVWRGDIVLKNI